LQWQCHKQSSLQALLFENASPEQTATLGKNAPVCGALLCYLVVSDYLNL